MFVLPVYKNQHRISIALWNSILIRIIRSGKEYDTAQRYGTYARPVYIAAAHSASLAQQFPICSLSPFCFCSCHSTLHFRITTTPPQSPSIRLHLPPFRAAQLPVKDPGEHVSNRNLFTMGRCHVLFHVLGCADMVVYIAVMCSQLEVLMFWWVSAFFSFFFFFGPMEFCVLLVL